jgi:hypothetical protein
MIILGLLASTGLGLMALRGVTMLLAPEDAPPFWLPIEFLIPVALAFGLTMTYGLGRFLGLFGMRTLRDYESRRRIREEVLERPDGRAAVPEATIEY